MEKMLKLDKYYSAWRIKEHRNIEVPMRVPRGAGAFSKS